MEPFLEKIYNGFQIGNMKIQNSLFLAPMAGWTDSPFRRLNREFGCGCVISEMISSEGLIRKDRKSLELTRFQECEHPIGMQIFGRRPSAMSEAAKILQDIGADFIDINMGCPAKKVVRNTQGFALLENPELALSIVGQTVKAVSIPVTVKIRIGKEHPSGNIKQLVKQLADTGIGAVIVHARTKKQLFSGEPNLEYVTELKDLVNIPIIGNGGISSNVKAKKFMFETGCDGLMVGISALGNPWIFKEILEYKSPLNKLNSNRIIDLIEIVKYHLNLMIQFYGEYLGVTRFRKHFVRYTKALPGAKSVRQEILTTMEPSGLFAMIERYFYNLLEKCND